MGCPNRPPGLRRGLAPGEGRITAKSREHDAEAAQRAVGGHVACGKCGVGAWVWRAVGELGLRAGRGGGMVAVEADVAAALGFGQPWGGLKSENGEH